MDLDHPFDIALAEPTLEEVECPASQRDLLDAALANNNRKSSHDDFFSQPCISRPLSYMETIFNQNNRRAAMEILGRRHQIQWKNSEYHVSNQHPNLTWNMNHHYIDMVVFVSTGIGLSILLPNERDHAFAFQFHFEQPHRKFSAKFAKLGFDARGSFLWVGKCGGCEDVFIAWATIESLGGNGPGEDVGVGLASGPTQLSVQHYRITVVFFAFVFEKLGERGIWLFEEYPDLNDEEAFKGASNIL